MARSETKMNEWDTFEEAALVSRHLEPQGRVVRTPSGKYTVVLDLRDGKGVRWADKPEDDDIKF
jgi:hypothetical protein